jgi:hypothetical protein
LEKKTRKPTEFYGDRNISRVLAAISFATGVIAIGLLTLPYYLFHQFYIPKENAALGFIAPASTEGWTFLVTGFLLLCVTVVLVFWLRAKKKS